MASGEHVIRSYLVELGWDIDNEGMRRFTDAIENAGKHTWKLGVLFTGTATAVALGVEEVARHWQDLYYASQRIGDTVQNVNALNFAAKQVGLSADEMQGALDNFSRAIRLSPGLTGFLQGLGVDTTKGATSQFQQLMDYLVDMMKHGQTAIAERIGGMFGISDKLLVRWRDHGAEMKQFAADQKRIYAEYGIDQDKTGDSMRRFMQQLGLLEVRFEAVGTLIATDLMPIATGLIHVGDDLADVFAKVDKATHGWAGTLVGLASALGSVVVAARILKSIGALFGLGSAAAAGEAGAGAAAAGGGEAAAIGGAALIPGIGPLIAGGALGGAMLYKYEKDHPTQDWRSVINPYTGTPLAGRYFQPQVSPKGLTDKSREVAKFFESQGWSPAQAAGIAERFKIESGLDTTAIGDSGNAIGLGQWHPDRQATFKRLYGIDLSRANLHQQEMFAQWELTHTERHAGDALRGARTPEEAYDIFTRDYERPLNPLAGADRAHLGARQIYQGDHNTTVTLNQKTDIHVTGDNRHEITHDIYNGQERVNADMVRRFKGAVDVD